jgi:hypothetical protein
MGLPLQVLQRAAGFVQQLTGYLNEHVPGTTKHYNPHLGAPAGRPPYGDDVHDYSYIGSGFQYASAGNRCQ